MVLKKYKTLKEAGLHVVDFSNFDHGDPEDGAALPVVSKLPDLCSLLLVADLIADHSSLMLIDSDLFSMNYLFARCSC